MTILPSLSRQYVGNWQAGRTRMDVPMTNVKSAELDSLIASLSSFSGKFSPKLTMVFTKKERSDPVQKRT